MTATQRLAVVDEARRWLRTPYRTNAALLGCGADCAMFPLAVYRVALQLKAVPLPEYTMQWHLHRDEEKYLNTVLALGAEEVLEPQPGDFALWKLGRVYSHGAIVIAWPRIIHAVNPRGVLLADADSDELLRGRSPLFFTL